MSHNVSGTLVRTSSTRSLSLTLEDIDVVQDTVILHAGSVVVCEVVSIGAHKEVEDLAGQNITIKPGDRIIGVMGNRHSTTSMYGGIPASGIKLPTGEQFALLSSGGVIGRCDSSPSYLGKPTELHIIGLAYYKGECLEIRPQITAEYLTIPCPLILIAGTTAGTGKTKFAMKLIHFISHDLRQVVVATKLAGAGNLDDLLKLREAGAQDVFDFVQAGLVTTYEMPGDDVVKVAKGVLNRLSREKPDYIVAELGGDISGANVPALLADKDIQGVADALILVPSDMFAAQAALSYLDRQTFPQDKIYMGYPIKNLAASRERARDILKRDDLDLYDCENAVHLKKLMAKIAQQEEAKIAEREEAKIAEQEDEKVELVGS